jgi:hypothetical protein
MTQKQKDKQPNLNMGRKFEHVLFQGRYRDGQ